MNYIQTAAFFMVNVSSLLTFDINEQHHMVSVVELQKTLAFLIFSKALQVFLRNISQELIKWRVGYVSVVEDGLCQPA
jgi:hypothetical protein